MDISLNNVIKTYNDKAVLNINHLIFEKGKITGIVGGEGAGKTMLLRAILDLIRLDHGTIHIGNWPVDKSEDWRKVTSAFLGQDSMFNFLTPEEYFYFVGSLSERSEQDVAELIERYSAFFNGEVLGEKKKYIRDFSVGNIQKIGIIAALISRPEVLLLDEPFKFMDSADQIRLQEILVDANKNDLCTIVISSQDITQLAPILDREVLLEKGFVKRDLQVNE